MRTNLSQEVGLRQVLRDDKDEREGGQQQRGHMGSATFKVLDGKQKCQVCHADCHVQGQQHFPDVVPSFALQTAQCHSTASVQLLRRVVRQTGPPKVSAIHHGNSVQKMQCLNDTTL